MADKYQAGGELLADSEEFLTGKDGTFSGTVTATGFQLPGGLDTGLPYPTGTVLWWPTDTAPTGWRQCDGAAISRTTNSDLYGVIGTSFGPGDDSTTFNIPTINDDIFIRGWGSSGGIDPGRSFGSEQAADIGDHSHTSDAANAPHTHTITCNAANTPHNHGFAISAANMPHQHNANTGAANAPHKHSGNLPNSPNHSHSIRRREEHSNPGSNYSGHWNTNAEPLPGVLSPAGGHSHTLSFGNKQVPHTHPANVGNTNVPHAHPTAIGSGNAPHNHGTKTTAEASDVSHTHAFNGGDGGSGDGTLIRPTAFSMMAIIKL